MPRTLTKLGVPPELGVGAGVVLGVAVGTGVVLGRGVAVLLGVGSAVIGEVSGFWSEVVPLGDSQAETKPRISKLVIHPCIFIKSLLENHRVDGEVV